MRYAIDVDDQCLAAGFDSFQAAQSYLEICLKEAKTYMDRKLMEYETEKEWYNNLKTNYKIIEEE